MANKLKTAIEYTKNILTTGAISETSPKTEEEISSMVGKDSQVVVELGMGHGNITKAILARLPKTGKLYAFEVNPKFCTVVKETIQDLRLHVINDSAENIAQHVSEEVDNIVSSLPLTIISKEVQHNILSAGKQQLKSTGTYSQILYNKNKSKKFAEYYSSIDIKRIVAFPLQFVYHCQNTDKGSH